MLSRNVLAVLTAIWLGTNAHPAVPAPDGESYFCGTNHPISSSDINNAFKALQATANSNGNVYIDGQHADFGTYGGAQFYVCNNAKTTKYFTLDSTRQSDMNNQFAQCGGDNSFWVDDGDGWSWGVDFNGNKECSFGASP